MKEKMNTQEFARLCGVEKRTLFYYDEIELLKPEYVQENGYRIYTLRQYQQMDILKALQSTGMSLKEIQNLVQSNNLQHYQNIYERQVFRLEQKITQLQQTLDYLKEMNALLIEFHQYALEGLCQLPTT